MKRSLVVLSIALVALTAVAACSPLSLLNATASTDDHRQIAAIAYGSNPRQKLDLYVPEPAPASMPVVVFFYGGSWQGGKRQDYRFAGEALASRGFLAVVVDYRVYPEVLYPEFLRDGAAAVRWVHDHIGAYGGDSQRMFVMGHSSGAYNAAMLALDGRWLGEVGLDPTRTVRGLIGLSGPYDFLPIVLPNVQTIFGPREQWPSTQPIGYVSPGAPPVFLATGDADETVLPRNSRRLALRLRAVGVPVEATEYPGVGHIKTIVALARPFRNQVPVLADVARFVNAH